MSLYEATAYLFYGVRVQRTGRRGDRTENPPLGSSENGAGEIVDSAVEDRLRELGHAFPDWMALPHTDPESTVRYRAYKEQLERLSFGCELSVMGSGEADDEVIYAIVSESEKSCSSEDDHGGFGETVLRDGELIAPPRWDEQLRKFCELMKIPYTQPRWTLSMRG